MVLRRTLSSSFLARHATYLGCVSALAGLCLGLMSSLASAVMSLLPSGLASAMEPSRVEQRTLAEARSLKRMARAARAPIVVTVLDAPLAPIGYLAATLDVAEAAPVPAASDVRIAEAAVRAAGRCRAGCLERKTPVSLTQAVVRPAAKKVRLAAPRPKPVKVTLLVSPSLEPARDVLHRNLRATELGAP